MMDDNLTEYGMEHLRVYSGGNGNHMLPRTKPKVHPSVANSYAPGSPKPMKDIVQDNGTSRSDLANMQQNFSGLNFSPTQLDNETNLEMNGMVESCNVDENVKDGEIKCLRRTVTVQQAKIYQLEGMLSKLEARTRERDQYRGDFERAREELAELSQEKDRLVMTNKQLSENLQLRLLQQNNSSGSLETLYAEINRLKLENHGLKKSIDSLTSEKSFLQESLNASDFGSNFQGSGPLMSTPVCTNELEYLHQVVDSLKKTVLQQRDFLLKLKPPQQTNTSGLPSGSKGLIKTGTKSSKSPQDSPRLRQGEEGCVVFPQPGCGSIKAEDTIDGLLVKSPAFRHSPPASVSGGAGGVLISSKDSEIPKRNHQDSTMTPPAFEFDTVLLPGPFDRSGGYSDAAGDKSDSPPCGAQSNEVIYMNSGDRHLPPPLCVNPPKLGQNDVKSTSPKRDLLSVNGVSKTDYQGPARKASHSGIISQRSPIQIQPVRSKTETYGYNPRLRSQLHPGSDAQWQRQPVPSGVAVQQHDDSKQHWPMMSSKPVEPVATPLTLTPLHIQAASQSSQYYVQQQLPLLYSNASVACGDTVVDRGVMHVSKSTTQADHITPAQLGHMPYVPNNSNRTTADSPLSSSPRERLNSDRLCPVCNRDFGSVSIEQFQSHVLECFDNENGPETIVTDEPGPQRLCPMCNTSFGDNMSQSEFEKHVHSHFGEEPGENFEVLHP